MMDDIFDGQHIVDGDAWGLGDHFWSADQVFSPWQHDAIVGSPELDADFWNHQTTAFTCAVVSQQMILRQFGVNVSEAQLVYDATSRGWLTDHGTSVADVGRLLEYYGVPVHQCFGNGIESIASELAKGHKVIVAVDGGEMWKQDWFFEDWIRPDGADHAIVVTGLDMSDPNFPKVCVNDPGDPMGAGRVYPLEEFLDAWADSGNFYVATDHAPSALASHNLFGANFNPDLGLYMDQQFWMDWLQEKFPEINVPLVVELLKAAVAILVTASAADMVDLDAAWDHMDDAGRNELLLTLV